MNTYLSHLSQAQQQRINHVYHNVTQADANMRINGLRYYTPQLDAVEKGVLYNVMRDHWTALSDEERRIYARMAQEADYALNGRGVGNATVASDAESRLKQLFEFMNLTDDQIKAFAEMAKNPPGKVSFSVDISGLAALGYTGLEKTTPPDKSFWLETKLKYPDGQRDIWDKTADAARRMGVPYFAVLGGHVVGDHTQINAVDFTKFRAVSQEIEILLSLLFSMFGGTGQVRIQLNAGASWLDKTTNIHIPNAMAATAEATREVVKVVKEAAKDTVNNLSSGAEKIGKWLLIAGSVVVVGYVGVILLAARLIRPEINVRTGSAKR